MSYSLARLKRDAKEGKLRAVMTVRLGKEVDQEYLPEPLRGSRKIVGANTTSLKFEVASEPGKVSTLVLPNAALVEYTDDYLRIYSAGYREPNGAEQKVLDEWKAIENTTEFKERAEYDVLTDGSYTYWKKVGFFQDKGMEYLMGHEKQRGLLLDFNRCNQGDKAFIRDDSIRGGIEMEYRLERERSLEEQIRDAEGQRKAAPFRDENKGKAFVRDEG